MNFSEKFKKFFLSSLLGLFLITSIFTPVAHAQQPGPWFDQSFPQWYEKVYDERNEQEIFGERYSAAQVQWIFYGIMSFVIREAFPGDGKAAAGCLMINEIADCIDDIKQAVDSLTSAYPLENEALAGQNRFFEVFTNRPISSVEYFRDVGSKLGLVKEARAQGVGFGAGNPILEFWKISRNLSYALLILVVIVFSFMIMFRVKINPQTVITVQSALPKIAGALFFITFSYAIVGIIIDIMYVVIGLVAAIATSWDPEVSTFSTSQLFGALTTDRNAFSLSLYYILLISIQLLPFFLLGIGAGAVFGNVAGATLVGILIVAIILIVLFVQAFRIWWLLIKTYLNIIFQIMAGPFIILFGTLTPGGGVGAWIRSVAAQVAVYPTVALMFFMAFVFGAAPLLDLANTIPLLSGLITRLVPFNINPEIIRDSLWDPPLTVGTGGAISYLLLGASFVIFTLIPKAADIIKGLIEGRPFAYGTAIGEAVAPVTGAYGAFQRSPIGRAFGAQAGPQFGLRILDSRPVQWAGQRLAGGRFQQQIADTQTALRAARDEAMGSDTEEGGGNAN